MSLTISAVVPGDAPDVLPFTGIEELCNADWFFHGLLYRPYANEARTFRSTIHVLNTKSIEVTATVSRLVKTGLFTLQRFALFVKEAPCLLAEH